MIARLALLFILVPLLELVVLIQLGQVVGLWPTIGLVVVTGAIGAAMARTQGLKTLFAFQASAAEGRIPAEELQDGLAILVGGALLLTPGLLTDLVGFALLAPPTRTWIQARVRKALLRRLERGTIRVTYFGSGAFHPSRSPFDPTEARPEPPQSPVREARVIEVEPEETQ